MVELLPAFNAALNGLATCFLLAGFGAIKFQAKVVHGVCMAGAVIVSGVFLVTYVAHKILVQGVHTPFGGDGWWAVGYYIMLVSHIILAMVIVPLVFGTLWQIKKRDFMRHRRWARITFPLWLYVSITGVLIYFFLYQWFPHGAGTDF